MLRLVGLMVMLFSFVFLQPRRRIILNTRLIVYPIELRGIRQMLYYLFDTTCWGYSEEALNKIDI